jgi:hypothetical protein
LEFFGDYLIYQIRRFSSEELHFCATVAVFQIPDRMTDQRVAIVIESIHTVMFGDI